MATSGSQSDWTAWFRLLGQLSDRQISRLYSIPIHEIRLRRQQLRIPAYQRRKDPLEWTNEMLQRIGEASDTQVARELGLAPEVVAYKRRSMNVSAHSTKHGRPRIEWTREMLTQLGRVEDKALAKQYGISYLTVQLKRQSLDIGPKRGEHRRFKWIPKALHDVAQLHPLDFAKKYGVHRNVPDNKRKKMGLPPPPKRIDCRHVEFTDRMRALLGKRSDGALARSFGVKKTRVLIERKRLGISAWSGHLKAWSPEVVALLGKVSDSEVVNQTGISHSAVQAKRQSLGIPALFHKPKRIVWTAAKIALLGTASDSEVGRLFGRSDKVVWLQRVKLGIRPHKRGKKA